MRRRRRKKRSPADGLFFTYSLISGGTPSSLSPKPDLWALCKICLILYVVYIACSSMPLRSFSPCFSLLFWSPHVPSFPRQYVNKCADMCETAYWGGHWRFKRTTPRVRWTFWASITQLVDAKALTTIDLNVQHHDHRARCRWTWLT
jgi:hypothetical protein